MIDKFDRPSSIGPLDDSEVATSKAIVLYTELMRCLIHDGNDEMEVRDHQQLAFKVFLVFQEMRNAGATLDVAC